MRGNIEVWGLKLYTNMEGATEVLIIQLYTVMRGTIEVGNKQLYINEAWCHGRIMHADAHRYAKRHGSVNPAAVSCMRGAIEEWTMQLYTDMRGVIEMWAMQLDTDSKASWKCEPCSSSPLKC
jgi:hypothetical protein